MTLQVTALYAVPLALIYLALWFNIARTRGALKVSIGHADNTQLHERIRCHGNFVDWVPMVMILMILAESLGADAIYLHVSGALLLLGRAVHPFGLKADNAAHPLRYIGNSTNILAMLNALVCITVKSLGY